MRISGWLVGFVVFGMLALSTAFCSIAAYSGMRGLVIDTQANNNILLESPIDTVSLGLGILTGRTTADELVFSTTPTTEANGETRVILASPTPLATLDTQTLSNVTATPSAGDTTNTQLTPAPTIDSFEQLRIRDPRQIRILLLGIDQRSATGDKGPFRTDTMMLINIDPVRKTIGVISLPRDLWVSIPNFEYARINTANYLGDLNAYPGGGGPALAMETVAGVTGIRVDKYVLINFDVFTAIVDVIAPNGVEVCVTERIDDPKYPDAGLGIMHITFDPGCQRLNAERLLQYARTRATQGGDFDRARRQQEVLDATLKEVISAGGISNFFSQAGNLWSQLSGSFKTNLTFEELVGIGLIVTDIPRDDIHFAVIDNNYVDLGKTPDGTQDILIPQQARISDLIQRVFYPQNETSASDLKTRAEQENASIVVFNGTDIAGLANSTREWLTSRGISVVEVGNIPAPTNANTIIKDYTGKSDTARYLASVLGIGPERIQPGTDGMTTKDIMIVVGPDVQPLLSGGN